MKTKDFAELYKAANKVLDGNIVLGWDAGEKELRVISEDNEATYTLKVKGNKAILVSYRGGGGTDSDYTKESAELIKWLPKLPKSRDFTYDGKVVTSDGKSMKVPLNEGFKGQGNAETIAQSLYNKATTAIKEAPLGAPSGVSFVLTSMELTKGSEFRFTFEDSAGEEHKITGWVDLQVSDEELAKMGENDAKMSCGLGYENGQTGEYKGVVAPKGLIGVARKVSEGIGKIGWKWLRVDKFGEVGVGGEDKPTE